MKVFSLEIYTFECLDLRWTHGGNANLCILGSFL